MRRTLLTSALMLSVTLLSLAGCGTPDSVFEAMFGVDPSENWTDFKVTSKVQVIQTGCIPGGHTKSYLSPEQVSRIACKGPHVLALRFEADLPEIDPRFTKVRIYTIDYELGDTNPNNLPKTYSGVCKIVADTDRLGSHAEAGRVAAEMRAAAEERFGDKVTGSVVAFKPSVDRKVRAYVLSTERVCAPFTNFDV